MTTPDPGAPPRVAVINSSVREGRFAPRVGAWVHKSLVEAGVDTDVINLCDLVIPADMSPHPDSASFAGAIGQADAILIITPEYNHSFPGPLKTAIDAVREQWRAKPVAFVSYGGMAGGLRAVEALRLVFAELHAVTVRDSVSLHNPWGPAEDPRVEYPDQAATAALHQMMRQLSWWAGALRDARHRTPYPG
ncbi:putative NADPH-dependent FMN reductase [Actinoplanes missouriensis 431]|uniref:Putative NADPH-dependent FMN reductase n=1 Tax=Actinoplanes missouriensis (strain ATCC 14538 / DSM 43046 / CBS 188.64 / JCM 3121 / NBRC 102363 / NCIMB 12654 / NRRL B-3342 / UNCC 431) TaxID=512565 RepID=I0H4F4_ACTM4|nr:NAD(P)H-dependent oxidoreductase [Actinoplanes missouriensis]BAL87891.1 putative NADPH-dependent FMN reductase [Actinoplanes missouriensis 431]